MTKERERRDLKNIRNRTWIHDHTDMYLKDIVVDSNDLLELLDELDKLYKCLENIENLVDETL